MHPLLRALLPSLALLMAAAPPLCALDFTLHRPPAEAATQGGKPYFLDGNSKIFVDLPADWTVTDSPASLDCLPGHANCRVLLEQAGSQPWPFDEPGRAALRKRVLASVPQGAKAVQGLPEQADLVPLTGWSSLELGQAYEFFGQKMRRAQLFLNLPEKRVWQMTITAPEADFAAVHEQARLLLYGLFEPTKMLSPSALQRYNDGIRD